MLEYLFCFNLVLNPGAVPRMDVLAVAPAPFDVHTNGHIVKD